MGGAVTSAWRRARSSSCSWQQVRLGNYGKVPAPSTLIPVTLTVPPSGVVYLAIHLEYGLKKTSGYTKNYSDDAVDCTNPTRVLIPNHGSYTFSVGGAQTGATSIQNQNSFKRIPGVAGGAAAGDPHSGAGIPRDLVTNAKRGPDRASEITEKMVSILSPKAYRKAATF